MNHPIVNQIERYGYPIPLKAPSEYQLGICPCGCGVALTTEDSYIRWDGQYFTDRSCLIKYMIEYDGLEEVG